MKNVQQGLDFQPRSRGQLVDTSPEIFGFLEPARSRESRQAELRDQLERNGYLFLRDMFPATEVLGVRRKIC